MILLEKFVNKKYFLIKKRFEFISKKNIFRPKIFLRSCEKIKNISLFINYIKFGPQSFDCYIYIYIFQFNYLKFNLI